jgi:hypothetical protein
MSPQMSADFTDALRTALVTAVTETPAQHRKRQRRPWLIGGAIAFAALSLGTATAVAVTTIPGAPIIQPVADAVAGEYTGSAVITLGTPPAEATEVRLFITCLSEGNIAAEGWGSTQCEKASLGYAAPNVIDIPESHSVAVTADDGMRWSFEAVYLSVADTDWAVNENGQSYGAPRETAGAPVLEENYPDLVPVVASNGLNGYVYKKELDDANGTTAMREFESPEDALRWQEKFGDVSTTIPVYQEDGETVIGDFTIGG